MGSAAGQTDASYAIDGSPSVEDDQGDIEFVALDGEAGVDWSGYDTEIAYVETQKTVVVEDADGNVVVSGDRVAGTNIVAADTAGTSGSWALDPYTGVTLLEGADYDASNYDSHSSPPVHNPLDADQLDVGTDGEQKTYTVTVTQNFHLYADENGDTQVDSASAEDSFEVTVSNVSSSASVSGSATVNAG